MGKRDAIRRFGEAAKTGKPAGYGAPPGQLPGKLFAGPGPDKESKWSNMSAADASKLAKSLEELQTDTAQVFKSLQSINGRMSDLKKMFADLGVGDSGDWSELRYNWRNTLSTYERVMAAATKLRNKALKQAKAESRSPEARDLFAEMRELAGLASDDLSSFAAARDRSS